MKLEPVTKHDKRNMKNSSNCDIIVFFPIYGEFAAIRKPDFGRMVYKTYIFINSNLLSYRIYNKTKKYLTHLLYYFLSNGTIYAKKRLLFAKNDDISKINRV